MNILSSLYVCICALVCFFSCKTYCSVIQEIKHESNYFGPCLIINIQVSKMYFLKVFSPLLNGIATFDIWGKKERKCHASFVQMATFQTA